MSLDLGGLVSTTAKPHRIIMSSIMLPIGYFAWFLRRDNDNPRMDSVFIPQPSNRAMGYTKVRKLISSTHSS